MSDRSDRVKAIFLEAARGASLPDRVARLSSEQAQAHGDAELEAGPRSKSFCVSILNLAPFTSRPGSAWPSRPSMPQAANAPVW